MLKSDFLWSDAGDWAGGDLASTQVLLELVGVLTLAERPSFFKAQTLYIGLSEHLKLSKVLLLGLGLKMNKLLSILLNEGRFVQAQSLNFRLNPL